MNRQVAAGIAYGAAGGAMWGLVFLAPILTRGFSAGESSLGRYLAYGVVAAALAAPRWPALSGNVGREGWIALLWLGLAGNLVYYLFLALAVRLAGVAPASFIVGLLPVVLTIVGSREQGAVPLRILAPSLLLAVIGVALIAAAPAARSVAQQSWQARALGFGCACGALVSWALFAVGNARIMARLPHISSGDWSLLLGIVTGAEALLLAVPVFATAPTHHDANAWIVFIAVSSGVAIIASIIGNAFWNSACRRLPMTLTGQMVIFETLFALLYSFLWDRRLPTATEILAIIALVAAVSWCALHHRSSDPPPTPAN